MAATLRALDLFAGAGGASLGLKQAGHELVLAAEWDGDACATHRAALPSCPVYQGDVRQLDPPAAELWWASPPCQAWSSAGRRRGAQDTRNGWPWVWELYDRAAFKPSCLIVENVAGMTHHSKAGHGDPLRCAGCYLQRVVLPELRARFPHVVSRVLDAADYGLPQRRRRLFIVASVQPYSWPAATHCAPDSLLRHAGRQRWRTMRDALTPAAVYVGGGSNPHGKNKAHERSFRDLSDSPCTTITAAQIGNAGPFVYETAGHLEPWRSYGDALGLHVHADDCDMDEDCVCHMADGPYVLHHGRNTPRNPRQERVVPSCEPSPAVSGAGNQLLDRATGRRRLTVDECATLQGFPVWPWQGIKRSQYRQCGNAVPPELARVLAAQVVP